MQDRTVALMEAWDLYGSDSLMYNEAIKSAEEKEWWEAMAEEIDSLEHHGVHVEDDPPKEWKRLLRSRWLLETKRTMQGAMPC